LIDKLRSMSNIELLSEQMIERIQFLDDNDKPVELTMKCHQVHRFDHLVSAVPAFELASLLDKQHENLRSQLNQIKFVDMIVLNLLFKKEDIYPQEAFGYLIPSREHSPLLGVLFDSCVRQRVDGKKRGSQLTVMMGGVWHDQWHLDDMTDEQLMNIVRTELKNQINLDETPWHYSISRLNRAIPVC
jgi:protoporphyrinogen/coproporphyrinogen III oxidase